MQPGGMTRIGRDRSQHHIGMAADIFGGGLDGEIDAMLQRLEEQRRRPGIVHQHRCTMRVRGRVETYQGVARLLQVESIAEVAAA